MGGSTKNPCPLELRKNIHGGSSDFVAVVVVVVVVV
jgi:hypothetical protein